MTCLTGISFGRLNYPWCNGWYAEHDILIFLRYDTKVFSTIYGLAVLVKLIYVYFAPPELIVYHQEIVCIQYSHVK